MRLSILAVILGLAVLPARADTPAAVRDKSTFLKLVDGRALEIGLYRLTLKVKGDGKIEGRALGWDITGNWGWKDGLFCREMDWSGKVIPYNCQLVEAVGPDRLRFTADAGQGQSAVFRIR
ncbi:dihydrodipicolinate reductase [Aliigemmobacter aestuarii]|uniref:Dihydrodipicolinate reductase n=1 Tax=Aliigemmobacter aestuarii TaxID=1445661 RepID=A0A4S3MNG0_9RHOB|nr:dihydrodipicolinate reductase [Gemmobacter aestuarii]